MGSKQYIRSRGMMSSHVEVISSYNLVLCSGFIFHLKNPFCVPSFLRNLISVSRLVPFGFEFKFSVNGFTLFNKSKIVGYGTLSDGIYSITLQNNIAYNSLNVIARLKRCIMNEKSSLLSH